MNDIPKSTLWIGGAFWGVLASLMAWNLRISFTSSVDIRDLKTSTVNSEREIAGLRQWKDRADYRIGTNEREIAVLRSQVERAK